MDRKCCLISECPKGFLRDFRLIMVLV